MFLRQIVLDTETTGINKFGNYYLNHKIIEIGAIEIINYKITNNKFHKYINPNRLIDKEAYNIHGISNEFLKNKPTFDKIVDDFIKFIKGSELIIHNAKFDIDFINYELRIINYKINNIKDICHVIDSLLIARKKFPGKKNNLNALCSRFSINNDNRNFHGALLDAELLSKVFLFLIKKQIEIPLILKKEKNFNFNLIDKIKILDVESNKLCILKANNNEIKNHINFLNFLKNKYIKKIIN